MGFADDTNLLVFGQKPEANIQQLKAAWDTCSQWADTRGMAFAPEKSELIHFNKGRKQWEDQLDLAQTGGGIIPVKPVALASVTVSTSVLQLADDDSTSILNLRKKRRKESRTVSSWCLHMVRVGTLLRGRHAFIVTSSC